MLVLVSFIEMNIETGSSDIFEICRIGVKSNVAFWTMLSGLCFKLPVWPFCGWLPEAHSKSNFTCSVILASIILKFSALIMIRFLTPIFSEYIDLYKGAIFAVLIVSMTFSIARSAFQNDLKRFFAYFSIFHMNLYFMIALDKGRDSSIIFSMAQHSLIIMFLFVLTDIIEKKIGSRLISEIELSNRGLGKLRGFLMLGIVSLIGSPLTPGFISEIVSIYSVSRISIFCALAVTLTILATSFIAFNMYSSTFKQKSETKCVIDLTSRETLVLSLMTVCILALGIFPQLFCRQP
jgi:NADH-quinone oxidoreductase subunit M